MDVLLRSIRRKGRLLATAGALTLCAATLAHAETWTGTSPVLGNLWRDPANWTPLSFPDAVGATAVFGLRKDRASVSLTGTTTVGQIVFDSKEGYGIVPVVNAGAPVLVFSTATGPTTITSSGNGDHAIAVQIRLDDDLIVTNDATRPLTLTRTIAGPGKLVTRGSGQVFVRAPISNTGGFEIQSGSVLTAPVFLPGSVVNDGTLILIGGNGQVYTGTISGTGALRVNGTREVVLAGDNTFTGLTFIESGTLTLGNRTAGSPGTGAGSIVGDVVNNGTFRINRSGNPLRYGGDILGTGKIEVLRGALVLLGDATPGGGTIVRQAGVLSVGVNGRTGSLVGDVALDGGALTFRRSDAYRYNGAITGTGALNHGGSGRLTLAGTSTFRGLTTVTGGGTLDLAGKLAGGIRLFSDPAAGPSRLEGIGSTSGVLRVADGSTVAPGAATPGTLTVGTLYLDAGSVLEIDAVQGPGGSLTADRLNVTGSATFGAMDAAGPFGPTVLDVRFDANAPVPALEGITVLTAGTGLVGRAPIVLLDPASLPNGQNFQLDLEATNLGGTFAGAGELIPAGAGGAGVLVLQVRNTDPTYLTPNLITTINAPYLVPSQQSVLKPTIAPQLVPTATPTAVPTLVPTLVKGPTSVVTTPVVATTGAGTTPTGIKTVRGGVLLGGGTLVPQPQVTGGGVSSPTNIPLGTVSTVVVVDPPEEVVTIDGTFIPADPKNTDVVVVDPPDATTTDIFVSVSGSYGAIDQRNARPGARYALIYGPHKVDVALVPLSYGNLVPFGVAQTAAQRQVGRAVDKLLPASHARPGTPGQARLVAGLYPLGAAQIDTALAALSGTDRDPTFVSIMNDRLLLNAISARQAVARDGLAGATEGQGRHAWGELVRRGVTDDAYLGGVDLRTWGIALGADQVVGPDLTGGLAFGYADTSADLARGGSGAVTSLELAAYGSWQRDDWFANGTVGVGFHRVAIDRAIAFGSLSETVTGEADARSTFIGVEGGRRIKTGMGTIEPTVALTYARVRRDGYTESEPSVLARQVSAATLNAGQTSIGVRWTGEYQGDDMMWRPEVAAGLSRGFGDPDVLGTASFLGAPGMSFPVTTAGPNQDSGFVEVGISGRSAARTFFASYRFTGNDDVADHSFRAGLTIAF
ncbi:autotransporter-associated beta strand repeat-containing protein [Loktanella atrilutea]|uniref:Autotransporter-associated beta strand repeat-containing protein n=1 Tax=Loktanella atrilutea TaxID=366533 RepID=A0A1M5FP89_LOKAT|nr:autotransporter outer membrane beta-barrel domain-containing protein [Loktanella atrilutea]SHF93239.1 autotransporter-associated beta strand repeat-containing protein [Loktanella atrilutea]